MRSLCAVYGKDNFAFSFYGKSPSKLSCLPFSLLFAFSLNGRALDYYYCCYKEIELYTRSGYYIQCSFANSVAEQKAARELCVVCMYVCSDIKLSSIIWLFALNDLAFASVNFECVYFVRLLRKCDVIHF